MRSFGQEPPALFTIEDGLGLELNPAYGRLGLADYPPVNHCKYVLYGLDLAIRLAR